MDVNNLLDRLGRHAIKLKHYSDRQVSADLLEAKARLEDFERAEVERGIIAADFERMERLRELHAAWAEATFPGVGPVGPLKHLSKEAIEASERPEEPEEYADCLFLLWDAARRSGLSMNDVVSAGFAKLEELQTRTYPAPVDGEPCEHVREPGLASGGVVSPAPALIGEAAGESIVPNPEPLTVGVDMGSGDQTVIVTVNADEPVNAAIAEQAAKIINDVAAKKRVKRNEV